MNKGVAPFVSYIMFVGVGLAVVGATVTFASPIVDNLQDSSAIDRSINTLTMIDNRFESIARGDQGTLQRFDIEVPRGSYEVDEDANELIFSIMTSSGIVGTQASQQIGPVLLSANTDVTIERRIMNGTDCYWMENQYLETCIRAIDEAWEPRDDLVGYWRMNEGDGQWANDSSQYNNDAYLGTDLSKQSIDPKWTTDGRQADGLLFNVSDKERLRVPNSDSLDMDRSDEITLSAWTYIMTDDLAGGGDRLIFDKGSKRGTGGYHLEFNRYHGSFDFGLENSTGSACSIRFYSAEDRKWQHVAATYNGTHQAGYINGQLQKVESCTKEIGASSYDLYISDRADYNGMNFNGTLDELRIYNSSKDGEEVAWLANQKGQLDYINTSELMVHYRNHEIDTDPNMELSLDVDGIENTSFGTGHTEAEQLDDGVGRGRVTAEVNSEHGFGYTVNFDLLSGSDFLKVSVE